MQLNGAQSELFSEALLDAFSVQTLERMVFYKLNKQLYSYAPPTVAAPQVVFELIRGANNENWIDKLIVAAREANPGNSKLFAFAQRFGIGSTSASRQELERIIDEVNCMLDPDLFRSRLGVMEQRVCRVEITVPQGRVYGTGFLVSPNSIMTNYHVVSPVIPANQSAQSRVPPVNAIARFDYKRIYDAAGAQVSVNDGRTSPFSDDWLIDFSPNNPDGQAPTSEQLDCVLVRLRDSVGDDRVDGGANVLEPARRDFIPMPAAEPTLVANSSLFILEHPRGDSLKLAMTTRSVLGVLDNGTRVRHTTNTDRGSSGSPCFTPDWALAALHHSGDPDFDPAHKPTYNEGIPIGVIQDSIKQHGHAGALGRQRV